MRSFTFFLFTAVAFTACKPDPEPAQEKATVTMEISLMNGSEPVMLNDTVNMAAEYDLFLSLFRLYLSNARLVAENGDEAMLTEVALLDPASDKLNYIRASVPPGTYKELKVGFGVDPAQNDMDPSSFENAHPLSSYQSMYWSMLKYRFAKFEGKATSRMGGPANIFVSYHPGTNALYQQKSFPVDLGLVLNDEATLSLFIDINEIVDGPAGSIDFATEKSTHSTSSDIQIAEKFMKNLAASADLIISAPQN